MPLTDALILLRYLFELRGDNLIVGAVDDDAVRDRLLLILSNILLIICLLIIQIRATVAAP